MTSTPLSPLAAEFATLTKYAVEPELAQRLAQVFAEADPRDLISVNPLLIGEKLGLAERDTLRLLVAALHAGLVTLHWEVRCPYCGNTDHRRHELNNVLRDYLCEGCLAQFTLHLDDEVRVTFSLVERLHPVPAKFDPIYRYTLNVRLGTVSGHALLLLPEFQRLFPQQRVLPDESLDVTRVALLFTDLAGSTAIYARRGDPRAYHLVRLHFDELFRTADACGGLMIKTIGDAVMAAFQTPAEALRAALAMQEAIMQLNRQANLQGDEQLILKVGLHSGPCLSVTLNQQADYFGGTVNIAARVQGVSTGNDIVMTDAIYGDAEAKHLLAERELEQRMVLLKGIDEPVQVYRLAL